MQRMDTTPFTSEELGAAPRKRQLQTFYKPNYKKHAKKTNPRMPVSGQLLVKIGICAVACALILSMKALNIPGTEEMVSGVRTAINEKSDLDEMLGKLEFVELPDTLEVFSSDSKLAVPVNAPNVSVEPAQKYAIWQNAPGAEVVASAAGEVRAIGEDTVMGKYVRLMHAGDLETIYYGLETINVEEGQPIKKRDTLGMLGEDGMLRLSVLLSGEPQAPDTYLDLVLQG